MKCPFCHHPETKVLDKRETPDRTNRRRRECTKCGRRFTTYEKVSGLITKVKKRDGRTVNFNQEKITKAIWAAAQAVGGTDEELAKSLSDKVVATLEDKFGGVTIPTVEQVQDIVEKVLVENGHYKTAKAYILYREKHKKIRETKNLMIDVNSTIGEYLNQTDWRVKENANESFSFSGLLLHTAGKVMSNYNLNEIYEGPIAEAHKKGYIHIHDLSHGVIGYCAGWSLKNLLLWGFGGVSNKVDCKPAKHLSTVIHQMVNYIGCLQMEFAGAQAFNSVDTLLAPFVKADRLDYKTVKQNMQQLVFSLNIPSRWGSQYPFSNITFDWVVPEDMKNEKAVVGGKRQDFTYGDCQKEMDMINRAFLEVMLEGDAKGGVFTFPIPTYNITRDFKWDSKNAKLLFELTAKYGLPYFQNYIGSGLDPKSIRAMCLHPDEEIIAKINGNIRKTTIGKLCENFNHGFDKYGWSENEYDIKVMSLNKETFRLEWSGIKRFLKIKDNRMTTITTKDGKEIRVSSDHIVPALTQEGVVLKHAEAVKEGDILFSVRKTDLLSRKYQMLGSYTIDRRLAKFIGMFVAEGNYLYDSRKPTKDINSLKGFQFSFNLSERDYFEEIIQIVKEIFNYELKVKKDPRYNTIQFYMYNSRLAKEFYNAGLRKYGGVPPALFNSPKEVIETFLEYFFKGDGYARGMELHISDESLARDLVILYYMIGVPVTYRNKGGSQVIRIQHNRGRGSRNKVYRDILYDRIPNFLIDFDNVAGTRKALFRSRHQTVGVRLLNAYGGISAEAQKLLMNDVAAVEVEKVIHSILDYDITFYDIELEKNHLFVHSLGTITHNCCRLNINQKEIMKRPGGMWGPGDSTGSIGVMTVNVNRLAYEGRKKKKKKKRRDVVKAAKEIYFRKLDYYMKLCRDALETKREVVEKNMKNGLMPFTRRYLGTFRNHFSTIGLCGMNEACLNLLGRDISTPEGKEFAIETLKFMREKCHEFQKETGNLYNLEATPAESTSYRLAREDKKMYGNKIITAGDKVPYLTNSTYLPADKTDDLVFALEHQNDIQPLYTGGTMFHTFLGERLSNGEAAKTLVRKIAENTKLPYFSITPTFSICKDHGYIKGEHFKCPKCKKECEVYTRIVGYFRPVQQWNEGKTEEYKERKEYSEKTALSKPVPNMVAG